MALAGVRVTAITGYRRNPVVRFFSFGGSYEN
nr:MAG TPA: hypothetical protein [Caudoviricetes sp.]DAZ57948.1 MAG TPA: hypothetical protein [Caudoviricetes sp.]